METPIGIVLRDKGTFVHCVPPYTSLAEAVHVMIRHRIGSVVVTESGSVVGVLGERDVLVGLAEGTCSPATTLVSELMNSDPLIVDERCTVRRALTLMTGHRTRHLPVCDGDRLIGIVSIGDLTRWMTHTLQSQVEDLQHYILGEHA